MLKPMTKKYFNSSWHYKMLIISLVFFVIPINSFIKLPIKPISNISNFEIKGSELTEGINTKKDISEIVNNNGIDKQGPEYEIKENLNNKVPNPIKRENKSLSDIKFNINPFKDLMMYLWLAGVIIILLVKSIQYIKFKSFILKYSMEIEEKNILNLFNACKKELNINKKISLRACNGVSSPMLIGILRPIVLIPNIEESHKSLRMIFLHELYHFKRKDILIKAFGLIIKAIHCFNPFTYILLKEIDKYCEYSIDEKVVEDMDINDRKYYGETILSLIGSSIVNRATFTTAMGSSGEQLKTRLENMIYSFKTTRRKQIVSLFVGVLILVSGLTAACSILPSKVTKGNDSFVVYIKEDGLYYSYLDNGNEIKIHEGNNFEYPLISKEGAYIAYTKGDSLYIYNVKDKTYEEIDDEIEHYYMSYDWIDDESIIYGSHNKPGFKVLNLSSGEITEHLDEYFYTGLVSSNERKVYATKINKWTTAEGVFWSNEGIVEIDLKKYDKKGKNFFTNIIVEGRKSTEDTIGYNPIAWNVSPDGRYIYIMEKPASESLSSDGMGIGIYDVKEKTHTELADMVTLSYKNHLAINPNNNVIGLIEGAGREMIENKEVILVNINKDKSYKAINFMDRDLVAMTPSFSLDGKRLFYSATKNLGQVTKGLETSIYERWHNQPHYIYQYDLDTSKVEQITEGEDFDFMPVDISNNEILFTRYKADDYYSLIKLANGKENIVADNIMFRGGKGNYSFGFYGHIDTEMGMDVFINENTKPDKKEDFDSGKIDELYKLKGTYIGDNSKVGHIISLLDFPKELTPDGIELFTKEEPFGLRINFKASDETIARYISSSSDYVWRPQSLILFSLVDNLEYIQYRINNDDVRITASYINRQVADSLTSSALGHKVSEAASNKKLFKEFYNIYGSEYNIRANEPEGIVGHIVIRGNTLHFREAEVVEWDDQKRVKELGLKESDFPNGYSIIHGDNGEKTFELTDETIYTFTDVNNFFMSKPENNMLYTTTKKEELLKHLGEYNLNDNHLSEQNIPYFIEIKDGKVISITEKFKYTI